MTVDQREKGRRLRALHAGPRPFVIGNVWDGASARIFAGLGFEALATSSYVAAATLGRVDGQLTRDEALAHVALIAGATELPLSADLENGFGDEPAAAAEAIRRAAAVGAVGGSIEDVTGDPSAPLYERPLAVERVAAAAEAAHALPFPFTLTARSEGFVRGRPDLEETIWRLQAFEKAGADVLFAPGLADLAAVRAVCQAVSKPVNFMAGVPGRSFDLDALAAVGVKRVSLAASAYRHAMGAVARAGREIRERGTFAFVDDTLTSAELKALLTGGDAAAPRAR